VESLRIQAPADHKARLSTDEPSNRPGVCVVRIVESLAATAAGNRLRGSHGSATENLPGSRSRATEVV